MAFNSNKGIRLSMLICLIIINELSSGQTYRFRNYGVENNLPSEVVYTVNQDNNGYIWVGTTEGLSRFDGFSFYKVQFPDSASGRYPTVSYKDKNGNLWFGCNDGTLYRSSGRSLVKTDLPNSSGTEISSIFPGPGDNIYIVPQRKPLYRIDPGQPGIAETVAFSPDPSMFSAVFAGSDRILIGTQENLLVCKVKGDSIVIEKAVDRFEYSRIMAVYPYGGDSDFIVGTDGSGLFKMKLAGDSVVLSRFDNFQQLGTLPVRSIFMDSRENYWISTAGNGVARMQFMKTSDSLSYVQYLDRNSGLSGDYIRIVFEDSEGNIWLGYNGDGLSVLTNDSFEFLVPGGANMPKSIIFADRLGEDYVLGTPWGYYIFDLTARKARSFVQMPASAGRTEISSYHIDNEDNIWIGTRGSGLWLKSKSGEIVQFYRSGDTGADNINSIAVDNDNVWLSTITGINVISRRTKVLQNSYSMNNGLSHNYINQVLLADDGSGYVASITDRLYRVDIDSGIFKSDAVMYGILLNKINSLARDSKGVIWAATEGNGVFACHNDSVSSLTTSDGLLSNYTYRILADTGDEIWVTHEMGISRYDQKSGITRTYSTDFANGGSCNNGYIYESPEGKIFFGTTEGVIVYDRTKDQKAGIPPVNNINAIIINDIEYPYQSSFSLPYRKRYNVKISYTGINFGNPEKVYYSTFLENYDDNWTTPSTSREVSYNLSDGRYKFNLVSVNEDGLTQEIPLSFVINISKPVWRTWWFILSLMALAVGIMILIIRQREKAQKKIQQYLETELAARTKVVMEQKSKLEAQNLEITDSINYARRIQSSILPDLKRLKEHFRDAFVLFFPRDIVSGDFYWFDNVDDEKFILVCADSTGHGVPGAFMSMIGSTLLQDIVSRQHITKPSEILTLLDKQIFSTLNQNLEVGVSNDGMDIIVCEFSMKNRHVRFASAMRPVVLVMGGESYYIKGNRASVGGQTVMEKYFDDQEYYLSEGDSIYMFTDGLPDQFGGPEGKKMKIARLRKFLEEIHMLPVEHQEEALAKFYNNWKGDYEQVDDILFMGVKV